MEHFHSRRRLKPRNVEVGNRHDCDNRVDLGELREAGTETKSVRA